MLRLVFPGESGGERTVGGGEEVVGEVGAGFGDGEGAVGGRDGRAVLRKILRRRRRGKGKGGARVEHISAEWSQFVQDQC